MKKILWVKFGWSEFYRGGPVDGNFPFLLDGEQGHEAWNFLRQENELYGCYTPPQGASASTPSNIDPHGWTVVCLAKKPGQTGIHIVGWYEDATLVGHYKDRPANFDPGAFRSADDLYHYSIESESAYLVPSEYRTRPFSHPSVRTGKYSFLSGPNVELTRNKSVVLETIEREMSRLKKLSIRNPDVESAPDRENDEDDPLAGFGTPEHRKEVEEKSVAAVQSYLERNGYTWTSREKDNVGYDLEAFRESDSDELHVEVKGTSGSSERFFMTLNEHNYLEASEWRLAMVTNTFNQPNIRFYTLNEFRDAFDFGPMVWKGVKRKSE